MLVNCNNDILRRRTLFPKPQKKNCFCILASKAFFSTRYNMMFGCCRRPRASYYWTSDLCYLEILLHAPSNLGTQ